MKSKIISLFAAGTLVLATCVSAFAVNDSTEVKTERAIEQSAQKMAAETIELAANAVKQARENTDNVKTYVDKRLNDTILNREELRQYRNSYDYTENYNTRGNLKFRAMEDFFSLLDKSIKGLTGLFITIIIVSFFGVFINRHQKYKIIEKAIENNYPLPDGLFGNKRQPSTTIIKHIHCINEQNEKNIGKKIIKEYNVSDWGNFRSGVKWCAWGISFAIFFIVTESPAFAFALIPIIIGAGKLYTAYFIKQSENINKVVDNKENGVTPPVFKEKEEEEA